MSYELARSARAPRLQPRLRDMNTIAGLELNVRDFAFFDVVKVDLDNLYFSVLLSNNPGSIRGGKFREPPGHDAGVHGGQPRLVIIDARVFHLSFHIDL